MIRLVCYIACFAILLTIMAVCGMWFVSGGRIYSVQSNSMRPSFKAGDAVLAADYDEAGPRVGDIVTYPSREDPSVLISHRVIQRDKFVLMTKGDSNPGPDLPITVDAAERRVFAVAPSLGTVLNWVRTPIGLVLAVYVPAIFMAIMIIIRFVSAGQSKYRVR